MIYKEYRYQDFQESALFRFIYASNVKQRRKGRDTLSKFYALMVYNPTKYSSFYTELLKKCTRDD